MNVPLLTTKFYIPPPHVSQVARPRLLQRLDGGLEPNCRLILVSAPAGYGKTTLLSEWLFRKDEGGGMKDEIKNFHPSAFIPHPFKAAWLSLDEEDNSPMPFWLYLVAALQRVEPRLGQDIFQVLQSAQPLSPQVDLKTTLSSLINELSRLSQAITLVLDDYHLITSPTIHDTLAFFVEHLPPQLRLVLSTRSDPFGLPLTRLRARRQMIEIRAADLRFTPD